MQSHTEPASGLYLCCTQENDSRSLHTMLPAKAGKSCEQQQCVFRQTCAVDREAKTSGINSFTVLVGYLQGHLQDGLVFEHGLPAAGAKALHTHSSTSAQAISDHGWAYVGLTGQLEMHFLGARPGWEIADVLLGNR